jgi:hypothetical protein
LADLDAAPPAEQQRKQVTILFADISGFTAMTETMDAEDVSEIMNALWEVLDSVITGPVLLGEIGSTAEFTAMGGTVNTASCLEHAAPVGDVLISHNTYRHLRDVPLLIVALARPALFERRPDWGEGQPFHTRLDVRPLSPEESRRLVTEILQKLADIPESLRELVIKGAEGNPFYAEELIKMLIDDGVIITEETGWRVAALPPEEIRAPTTLTGVLQARLDSLPAAERAVFQQASVVGRIFWDGAVGDLVK